MFKELFIYFCLSSTIFAVPVEPLESVKNDCVENSDCTDEMDETNPTYKCDCINKLNSLPMTYYNQLTDDFGNVVGNVSIGDLKQLLSTMIEKESTHDRLQRDVEQVFQGVIVAVILFGICASICVFSAFIFCCRINISDNILRKDVEALSEKLKRDCRFKKSIKKTTRDPVSESCNIIVEEAGVFVV